MLSGNTTTSNDRSVESGWVAVAVAMNVPSLISAIDGHGRYRPPAQQAAAIFG
jgi:hypothetical protein